MISYEELNALSKEFSRIYELYPVNIPPRERQKLDWELSGRGMLPEMELLKTYSKVFGLRIIEEEELNNAEQYPDISLEYLETQCCIPFKWDENSIEIVLADPYGKDTIYYIFKCIFNLDVTFSFGRRSVLERLIQETYNKEKKDEDELEALGAADSEEALRNMASEAKIVRLVNEH